MAFAARDGAPWELLLLCLCLPGAGAAAPRSGVEQLLQLRAGGGAPQSCPGPGGGDYSAMPDAVIRIKDSAAAGARFLRAPPAVRDSRECVAACCAEPRCSVAVVELPRRPAAADAALGCYLFNCTARGRGVCKFAVRRGYRSYSLSRAREGGRPGPEAGSPSTAWASPRLGKRATDGGWDMPPGPAGPAAVGWLRLQHLARAGRLGPPQPSQKRNTFVPSYLSCVPSEEGSDFSVLGVVSEKSLCMGRKRAW